MRVDLAQPSDVRREARAVAAEAGVPFFYCSGSDFIEMFVGRGAARVRQLFKTAKKASPCILFVDELDAIGKIRNTNSFSIRDNSEAEQTLNQLLAAMDPSARWVSRLLARGRVQRSVDGHVSICE